MVTPYIHFQGNCREAMETYADQLGGELQIMGYDQMPDAPDHFAGSGLIMHSALMSPYGDIMASDFPPGMEGDPQRAVTLSLSCETVGEGRALFDRMSEGGMIVQPFMENFFSPGFGMLKDRFGTHWMIITQPEPE